MGPSEEEIKKWETDAQKWWRQKGMEIQNEKSKNMNKPKTMSGPWMNQDKWNGGKRTMPSKGPSPWKKMPKLSNAPWMKQPMGNRPKNTKVPKGPSGNMNMPLSSGWPGSRSPPNMWKQKKGGMKNSRGMNAKNGMWNGGKKSTGWNKNSWNKNGMNKKWGSPVPMPSQGWKSGPRGSGMQNGQWKKNKKSMSGKKNQGMDGKNSMNKESWMKQNGQWQTKKKWGSNGKASSSSSTKMNNKRGWNKKQWQRKSKMSQKKEWTRSRNRAVDGSGQKLRMGIPKKNQGWKKWTKNGMGKGNKGWEKKGGIMTKKWMKNNNRNNGKKMHSGKNMGPSHRWGHMNS